jgi:isopenicillin-N N-acyltransferase-like protein
MPIPILLLKGNARDRGRQHGAAFKDRIHRAVQSARERRGADVYSAALARVCKNAAKLRDSAFDLVDELKGISEATGLPVEEILLRSSFEYFAQPQEAGCSSVGVPTMNGAIVAQNWDSPPFALNELACMVHDMGDRRLLVIASVGSLGWFGMNDAGLALVNNDLVMQSPGEGTPSQFTRRLALAATDVSGALSRFHDHAPMSGRAYVLGDASGRAIAIEVAPGLGTRIVKSRECVLHTNHALDDEVAGSEDTNELERLYPSTRSRFSALAAAVDAADMPEPETVMAWLRDHIGFPNAICKHLSASEATRTCVSAVFHCGLREAWIALGNPCGSKYQHMRVTM